MISELVIVVLELVRVVSGIVTVILEYVGVLKEIVTPVFMLDIPVSGFATSIKVIFEPVLKGV